MRVWFLFQADGFDTEKYGSGKPMENIRIVLSIIFSLVFVTACSIEETPSAPERPAKIPFGAKWVGGLDGGVFVDFTSCANFDDCTLTIYGVEGSELYKGLMAPLKEIANLPSPEELNWNGWDGDSLYSKQEITLRVVGLKK